MTVPQSIQRFSLIPCDLLTSQKGEKRNGYGKDNVLY